MKTRALIFAGLLMLLATGCSLPPETPVTKDQLYRTGIYSFYTIKESPESVLAAINREGEVILAAQYKDRLVHIKILATTSGLQLFFYDR